MSSFERKDKRYIAQPEDSIQLNLEQKAPYRLSSQASFPLLATTIAWKETTLVGS